MFSVMREQSRSPITNLNTATSTGPSPICRHLPRHTQPNPVGPFSRHGRRGKRARSQRISPHTRLSTTPHVHKQSRPVRSPNLRDLPLRRPSIPYYCPTPTATGRPRNQAPENSESATGGRPTSPLPTDVDGDGPSLPPQSPKPLLNSNAPEQGED